VNKVPINPIIQSKTPSVVTNTRDNKNDQVEEDNMGSACSTNGREEESIYDFGEKSRRKETSGKI
jgi:hypothetical protein